MGGAWIPIPRPPDGREYAIMSRSHIIRPYAADQAYRSTPSASPCVPDCAPVPPCEEAEFVPPLVVSEIMSPLESLTMVVIDPSLLKTSLVVVLEDELVPDEEDEDDELLPDEDVSSRLAREPLPIFETETDI